MSDENIEKIIAEKTKNNELPCAIAFEVAKVLNIEPAAVGEFADNNKIQLVKCQLGLFGYKPEKKIVKPLENVDSEIESAIKSAIVNDRLPCKSAWEIAAKFEIGKMDVSGACETLGVKVKPCQLGAFK